MCALSRRNRRDFLRQLSGRFGAVALLALMQDDARASQSNLVEVSIDPINHYLPRTPQFAPNGWDAHTGLPDNHRRMATDELGLLTVEQPHGFSDFHATILAALGIHSDKLGFMNSGREEHLTGLAGNADIIPGVLA